MGDMPAWLALLGAVAAGLVGWGMALARAQVSIEQAKREAAEAKAISIDLIAKLSELASKIDIATTRWERLQQDFDSHIRAYARKMDDVVRTLNTLAIGVHKLEVRAGVPTERHEDLTPMPWSLDDHIPNGNKQNDR